MLNLDLLKEVAALSGYTITSGTAQDVINKTRAQRRLNMIKADIISRYGGKWDANYREGWLPLVPLYQDGTSTFTINSRTVTGTSTLYTSAMKGYKIKGADNNYYKIASVVSSTSLVLTQPYQGATSTITTNIWKDEYRLYPEVLTVQGFVNYTLPDTMTEAWPRNMKDSYPNPSYVSTPSVYTVIGRDKYTTSYSTGTISVTVNTNVWTGVGTLWQASVEPGMQLTVGGIVYHVLRVNSDTELETYQLAYSAVSSVAYSILGKNSLLVRFSLPTTQTIVGYWYWAKDYPFVNDNDEDWIAENYPKVITNGILYYDYLDKNDVARGTSAAQNYENSIKDMKVAVDNAYSGPRVLGYYLPDDVRD